jgi:hypothetical protein
MRPLVPVLALVLVAACTEEPTSPTTPGTTPNTGARPGIVSPSLAPGAPLPSVTSPVAIDNLNGAWVFGSRNEPPAGPVAACSADQVMSINEQGGTLAGAVAVCGGGCAKVETFSGSNNGGTVVLHGVFKGNLGNDAVPVDYKLAFDPKTQHLVGLRSGVVFWAAPWVVPETGCAASPSPTASIAPGGAAGGSEQ